MPLPQHTPLFSRFLSLPLFSIGFATPRTRQPAHRATHQAAAISMLYAAHEDICQSSFAASERHAH